MLSLLFSTIPSPTWKIKTPTSWKHENALCGLELHLQYTHPPQTHRQTVYTWSAPQHLWLAPKLSDWQAPVCQDWKQDFSQHYHKHWHSTGMRPELHPLHPVHPWLCRLPQSGLQEGGGQSDAMVWQPHPEHREMKEMIVDMRKKRRPHRPQYIRELEVERVSSFKYLGVHISDDLTWSFNTKQLVKRAQQWLYFLRRPLCRASTTTESTGELPPS